MEVRRLTARKEEIYRQLLGDRTPLVPSGVRHLIDVLGKHQACISHWPIDTPMHCNAPVTPVGQVVAGS